MAQSIAEGGFGVKLRRNGLEVAEVVDVAPPALTRATYDKTHHSSPNKWEEFGKGLKNGGEVTFTVNLLLTNPSHQAILADFQDDTSVASWDFVFPNVAGTTWTFAGIVTSFKGSTPKNEQMKADVTTKVSGQPILG